MMELQLKSGRGLYLSSEVMSPKDRWMIREYRATLTLGVSPYFTNVLSNDFMEMLLMGFFVDQIRWFSLCVWHLLHSHRYTQISVCRISDTQWYRHTFVYTYVFVLECVCVCIYVFRMNLYHTFVWNKQTHSKGMHLMLRINKPYRGNTST